MNTMNEKYKLVDGPFGLSRVIATRDITRHGVKMGDQGGLVESSKNFSQDGDCWIDAASVVTGRSAVYGDSLVRDSRLSGSLFVSMNAVVQGSVVDGKVIVTGNALLSYVNVSLGFFGGNAKVKTATDYLVIDSLSSEADSATMYRISDGGWMINIGCWNGTVDELELMIKGREWPSGAKKKTRKRYTPRFKAAIKLFRAHAKAFS